MRLLTAFEMLIFNAETKQDEEAEADVSFIEQNNDKEAANVKDEIMKLTNVSAATSGYILKALMAA